MALKPARQFHSLQRRLKEALSILEPSPGLELLFHCVCERLFSNRFFSFLLNQSRSMSLSYEKILRQELGFGEREYVACANLPMFSLHFLKVSQTPGSWLYQ